MKRIMPAVFFFGLLAVLKAFSVAFEEALDVADAASDTSSSISGIDGSVNSGYLLSVVFNGTSSISSVVGGGLTWQLLDNDTQTLEQSTYWAAGDPSGDPFTVTITYGSNTVAAGHVLRFTGIDQGNMVIANTGTTGNTSPAAQTITNTLFRGGDVYYSFCASQSVSISPSSSWTERGTEQTVGPAHHQAETSITDNTPSNTLSGDNNWIIHSGIVKASAAQVVKLEEKYGISGHEIF